MQGSEVKALRLKMGLNQEAFGRLLGYQKPQVRVSEIERGEKEVSNQVATICQLLETNMSLEEKIEAIKNILK